MPAWKHPGAGRVLARYGDGRGTTLKVHIEAIDVYGLVIHEEKGIERALGLECRDKMLLAPP